MLQKFICSLTRVHSFIYARVHVCVCSRARACMQCRLDWLTSRPQGSSWICFPSIGIIVVCHQAKDLYVSSREEAWVFMLPRQESRL